MHTQGAPSELSGSNRVLGVRRERDVGDRGRIRREEIQAVFNQSTLYTSMKFSKNKNVYFSMTIWNYVYHYSNKRQAYKCQSEGILSLEEKHVKNSTLLAR